MHKSDNINDFRVKAYIENMEREFCHMFNAYHKYISYRNKLLNELTISEEDKNRIKETDKRMKKNIKISFDRVNKEDFN